MPHATATVNGKTVAESDDYEIVEGNIYFPPASVAKEFFSDSNTHTYCGWKGNASYYNVKAGGVELPDAAWYYPDPMEKAKHIKDYVAFCECPMVVAFDGDALSPRFTAGNWKLTGAR